MTHVGTHIYCSAQTNEDRDIWLAALHSGLEITYAGFNDTLTTLSTLSNSNNNREEKEETGTIVHSTSKVLEPTILTPPIPQRYTKAHLQKLVKRIGRNKAMHDNKPHHNSTKSNPFLNPYETSTSSLSKTHCISCGKYPPEDTIKPYVGTPLTQYGLENLVEHICQPCLIGQGLVRHVLSVTGLYVSDAHERVALVKGLELMMDVLNQVQDSNIIKKCVTDNNNNTNNDDNDNNASRPKGARRHDPAPGRRRPVRGPQAGHEGPRGPLGEYFDFFDR